MKRLPSVSHRATVSGIDKKMLRWQIRRLHRVEEGLHRRELLTKKRIDIENHIAVCAILNLAGKLYDSLEVEG